MSIQTQDLYQSHMQDLQTTVWYIEYLFIHDADQYSQGLVLYYYRCGMEADRAWVIDDK